MIQKNQKLQSLQWPWWYRKLYFFFKIIIIKQKRSPTYVLELIQTAIQAYVTRHNNIIFLILMLNMIVLKFPFSFQLWLNGTTKINFFESLTLFKKRILTFVSAFANSTFLCQGLKLVTRMRLGLSHFRLHKFKHSFQDTLSPICNYGAKAFHQSILSKNNPNILRVLLFREHSFNDVKNTSF